MTQNKTVRFIKNLGPRTTIGKQELQSLGFLNVEHKIKQLRLNHAHKIFNNKCPSYLNNNFVKINDHHNYNTRPSPFNFVTTKIKGTESTTCYYNAIRDWNSLPDTIKSITHIKRFKIEVKRHLLDIRTDASV